MKTRQFIFLLAGLMSLASLSMQPFNDDWVYLSAPHVYEPSLLFPNVAFWRPIDAIIGFIVGFNPSWFPIFNHIIVIVAYWVALYTLYVIVKRMRVSATAINFSLMLFTVSAALPNAYFSVDSTNQTLSLAFGCLALLAWLFSNKMFVKYVVSYSLIVLSLFSKESGISWFFIVPLMDMLLNAKGWQNFTDKDFLRKNLLIPMIISISLIVVYFTLRMALTIEGTDLPENYQLHIGLNVVKGFILIFDACFTCLDTVAFFVDKNYPVVIITAVISFVFLLFIIKGIIQNWEKVCNRSYILIGLIIVWGISAGPHVLMGHPGELHAYPSLWIACLILAQIINCISIGKKEKLAGILFLCASLTVFVHKGYHMYCLGEHAMARTHSVLEQTDVTPSSVLILDLDEQTPHYSVFNVSASATWAGGASLRCYWGNDKMPKIQYKIEKQENVGKCLHDPEIHKKYDCIWIVENDRVQVLQVKE